jgi:molecular chaperone GrpE (heat shock protein)
MTSDDGRGPRQPRPRSAISGLGALELALQSQRLELESQSFARAILPLFDHIEAVCRGFAGLPAERQRERADAVAMLAEEADATVIKLDLRRIGSVGERFDTEEHEVVDTRTTPDVPRGTILEVVQHGWSYQGTVLRPAKVVAAIPASTEGAAGAETQQ